MAKWSLRVVAMTYLGALLLIPLGFVVVKAFGDGVQPVWQAISNPQAVHAFWLTVLCAGIAVPINTVFGILIALVLSRQRFRGRATLDRLVDLPFAISPVVVGLALVLVYGKDGWFGGALTDAGIDVIFSVPGMVLATIFVSLPFVAREVAPVLDEIGDDAEQAAATLGASAWQTFRRITLPAIRWGVIYGVVLTSARALGEFGAVSVVSGRISGQTETATLLVQSRFEQFDPVGAYSAALVLALMAVAVLVGMTALRRKEI